MSALSVGNAAVSENRRLLLDKAREGHEESFGRLLDFYRNYLQLVARAQLDLNLALRTSASDIVQETFLEACRKFHQFRGSTEEELLAWLRRILIRKIIHAFDRHVRAQKRDVRREMPLESLAQTLGDSSRRIHAELASQGTSPSGRTQKSELVARIADRLAGLPPQYREVIVLRNLEGLQFDKVAARMGRSVATTRRLWTAAIGRLRVTNDGGPDE